MSIGAPPRFLFRGAARADRLPVLELIAPEERQQALANVRAEVETRCETIGLRKDGSTFPVELNGRTIGYEGRPMRIVVAHDLTDRKRTEAGLRQALERNEALLREGNHCIKNNLQIVSSPLGPFRWETQRHSSG